MPVLIPPNIIRHARLTFAYLTFNAIGYFGLNVSGSPKGWASLLMSAGALCFFLWTVTLTRAGQAEPEPELSYDDPDLEWQWDELKEISRQTPKSSISLLHPTIRQDGKHEKSFLAPDFCDGSDLRQVCHADFYRSAAVVRSLPTHEVAAVYGQFLGGYLRVRVKSY
jgi:hypothetical protein